MFWHFFQDQRHAKLSTAAVFVKRLHDLAGMLQFLPMANSFIFFFFCSSFDLSFSFFPLFQFRKEDTLTYRELQMLIMGHVAMDILFPKIRAIQCLLLGQ